MKEIIVLGGGESGVGAALLAQAKGLPVFLSDAGSLSATYREELQAAGIAFEEGGHTATRILEAAEIVKSPGIPDTVPLLQQARQRGIGVIGEIEFAGRYTQAPCICITGSNGKTTTTLLTHHLLASAGLKAGLAGNIGQSFARQVLAGRHEVYVLEISSFMLDTMYAFRAHIAVLLNITPDHLDRYAYDFGNYVASKFRILQNMGPADVFITWPESPAIGQELARREPLLPEFLAISLQKAYPEGACLLNGMLQAAANGRHFSLPQSQLPLAGTHNALNPMAALLVGLSMGLSPEELHAGLQSFRNAPHRLEEVGRINGIRFINDSKATNVESVYYALGSFTEPLVLIMGGVDKGNDYSQIDEQVRRQVRVLICLGKDNEKLKKHFSGRVPVLLETQDVRQAVQLALAHARPGQAVLLSPACASFDLFKNYEDRGNQFRDAVEQERKGMK